jgi:hypothetical protein
MEDLLYCLARTGRVDLRLRFAYNRDHGVQMRLRGYLDRNLEEVGGDDSSQEAPGAELCNRR